MQNIPKVLLGDKTTIWPKNFKVLSMIIINPSNEERRDFLKSGRAVKLREGFEEGQKTKTEIVGPGAL